MSFYCNNTILLKPNNSNKSQTSSHTPCQRIPKCIKLMTDGPVCDVFYLRLQGRNLCVANIAALMFRRKAWFLCRLRAETSRWRQRCGADVKPIRSKPIQCSAFFVLSVMSVRLSCLSVTLVYCGQTVG